MPTPILMPALSPTMEQGKLAKWLKKEGDKVASGDVIAEIETDKATMEVEAVDEGILGRIVVAEGTEGVPVNTPIAILLGEGEDVSAIRRVQPLTLSLSPMGRGDTLSTGTPGLPLPWGEGWGGGEIPLGARQTAKPVSLPLHWPAARRRSRHRPFARERHRPAWPDRQARRGRSTARGPAESAGAGCRALDAAERGPSLVPSRAFAAAMPDDHIFAIYEPGSYEVRPLDNMRKTIAQRLTQAATTIPHFRLNVDCEIDALLDARERLNARSPKEGPGAYKLSVNDFIVKAMGLALQRVPDANATFTERGIMIDKGSDVGVAVAIEGGLFTPVIRGVEHKALAQISSEVKDMAARARRRRLAPHEYQGGTTAISTSACSASTISTRSSTRRMRPFWRWGAGRNALS